MGWSFDLEHINLVGYLTCGGIAPRVNRDFLDDFLRGMQNASSLRGQIKVEPSQDRLISTSREWFAEISAAARKSQTLLREIAHNEGVYESEETKKILRPFGGVFSRHRLFVLIVRGRDKNLRPSEEEFFVEAALSSGSSVLVLMPRVNRERFSMLDPFPPLQQLGKSLQTAPAVVFWTNKSACALSFSDGREFFRGILMGRMRRRAALEDAIQAKAKEAKAVHLLHISDLHFGERYSDRNRHYLKSHLLETLRGVHGVVLTGDAMESPREAQRDEFLEFRADIERILGRSAIYVPGNHDVRPHGNSMGGLLKQKYDLIIGMGWSPIVIDEALRVVFLCFNSSESGSLARGKISDNQLRTMATALQDETARRREIATYNRIAVVHHHPFQYQSINPSWIERAAGVVLRNQDALTMLIGAERFSTWCADRRVSVVLHGHKHVPHMINARIRRGSDYREMLVVGCGSSTGTKNSPMCYDVVSLNPRTGKSGVAFYEDGSGVGAGFQLREQVIDIREQESLW